VMTTTPVTKCPSTSLKWAMSSELTSLTLTRPPTP
jgi:hypothetical protein